MPSSPAQYDCLIIGAGLSGMAAGIRLAMYEKRVCILERHTTIGGLNSFYRLGGRSYDTGLHAVTNWAAPAVRQGPLPRLLRQLRVRREEFDLSPQVGSRISFPHADLRFSNDPELLTAEVARVFPQEADGFQRLWQAVPAPESIDFSQPPGSARAFLAEHLREPMLVEMLLCPLLYYGSAREDDMDLAQFFVMFESIYREGLCRPSGGIRTILKTLTRKYKELGGELRLRAGVERLAIDGDQVEGVVLEDGDELAARQVISSAGWFETLRLAGAGDEPAGADASERPGVLSFVEAISILDRPAAELGLTETIVFFNDHDHFAWRKPEGLCDVRSGVACVPDNFRYDQSPGEQAVRVTALANFDRWSALSPAEYRGEKLRWYDAALASAVRFVPEFRPHVVDTDMFTPTTIRRFTGHENGAVYGAPGKRYDGQTAWRNLHLCGTDQGFVGIIGALTSGIAMANRHALRQG